MILFSFSFQRTNFLARYLIHFITSLLYPIFLENYQLIWVSLSQISGISCWLTTALNNASQIQFLDLSLNLFHGSIPLLGSMNKLITLSLGVNNLSSTTQQNLQVFNSLTNCTMLESLSLNHNKLSGDLPSSVSNLSAHLQHFCIENNLFIGKLPRGIDMFQREPHILDYAAKSFQR